METLADFRKPLEEGEAGVDYLPVKGHVKQSYLDYSMSVILGRAIPDVRDGMKPVHRRILYAMNNLRLLPNTPYKKSARVVGDVIGKYHPHGDSSVYEAMVRMAQDFSLRYPFVDGQGNWGENDNPKSFAAMRYTEARMTEFAELMFGEIDMGTVDWRDNFDGEEIEPVTLPARIPMALVNSQTGIAVGMASDELSHNLVEVCKAAIEMFRDPDITLSGIMKYIKGPDFPYGAQITSSRSELKEIYRTGRGMLSVRAKINTEKLAGNDWQLVVDELPQGVSAEQILSEIEAISNPQPKKGKKQITQEQAALKQMAFSMLGSYTNDAGSDTGPIRIVFEPKNKKVDEEKLTNFLLANTSLDTKIKVNMTFINSDGRPELMGVRRILEEWTSYRFKTVTRRTEFRLDKVAKRIHILEGRLIVLIDIDEVISIIRNSDSAAEAKEKLIERFNLSDVQAEDILERKLRSLTRMDSIQIEQELKELRKELKQLKHLLGDRAAMIELIITEIEADMQKFGDKRRTTIKEAEAVDLEAAIIDEPVTIVLSKKGWIRSRQGHNLELSNLTFKDGDGLLSVLETSTAKNVVLLDNLGRAYTVLANIIPGGRGDGDPVTKHASIQTGANIVSMIALKDDAKILLSSTIGYGFLVSFKELVGRNRAGKAVLNVTDKGKMLPPVEVSEGNDKVVAVSNTGYMVVFELSEMPELTKGKGNKIINLKSNESLVRVAVISNEVPLPPKRGKVDILISGNELEGYMRHRGSRGKLIPKTAKPQ